jgi:hypothetical protein
MVIARFAGCVLLSPGESTVVFSKLGIHLPARSVTVSLPSSMSCRMATLVSALDCEAMRKRVSIVIFWPASLSRQPTACS